MIGLETIQLIQAIYFVRMVAPSSSTGLLSAINSIQYSAGGYHNAELFYGPTEDIEMGLLAYTADQFLAIDLKRFFLLNANISLFPVMISITIFVITLAQKGQARSQFL